MTNILYCRIELSGGALKEFLEKTNSMSPEDRGHELETDEGISKAHEESAQEGQTEVRLLSILIIKILL